jgi:hypothetical protein
MIKSAIISRDGQYRYALSRIWDEAKPTVLFVMRSPSTADGERDDRTITRCVNFATSWGYGGVHVTNLYAARNTETAKDPVGKDNVKHVKGLIGIADKVRTIPYVTPTKVLTTHTDAGDLRVGWKGNGAKVVA